MHNSILVVDGFIPHFEICLIVDRSFLCFFFYCCYGGGFFCVCLFVDSLMLLFLFVCFLFPFLSFFFNVCYKIGANLRIF